MPLNDSGSPAPLAGALGAAGLTKHDGHPFEGDAANGACARCSEILAHILHHPTRIRAACLLRGIDPAPLLALATR